MSPLVQIVVNPGSGEGRARATARRLEAALGARGLPSRTLVLGDFRRLVRWAKTCPPTFTHLACVGGDATLSAAAAAAVRLAVPLLPVPVGFGNMFGRAFGHRPRMEDVIELLRQGEVRWVDVGATTRELFLSHRSYGFLQRVQEMVEASRLPASRLGRHLAYYGMARRVLEQTSLPSIRVEADGRLLTEAAVLVTVANVVTYRGFLSLTPSASPTDGLFDVFIVPRTTKARLLGRLVRLMLHLPGRWRGAIRCRAQRVAVTVTGEAREELRVLRHALPVLVPAGRVAAAAPAPRRAAAAGGAARPAS